MRMSEEKKERPRNELFEALADVSQADPTVGKAYIGRVCRNLKAAGYTADDVYQLARMLKKDGWLKGPPTLGLIEQQIGRVRRGGAGDNLGPDHRVAAEE